jgi:hypothetical protein
MQMSLLVRVKYGEEVLAVHEHGEQHDVTMSEATACFTTTGIIVVVVVTAEEVRHGR